MQAAVGASALMGSSHRYVVPGAAAGAAGTDSVELEALDDDALKARFLVSAVVGSCPVVLLCCTARG